MKKLMIAAAIVCASAFAHAAVFNWSGSLNCFEDIECGDIARGSVEFFLNGNSLGSLGIDSYGRVAYDFALDEWGTVSAIATVTNFNINDDVQTTGTATWSKSIDVVWRSGYSDDSMASLALSGEMGTKFKINDLCNSPADNGYSGVPEPTSGLLLLLGVAGLALKRKRA